MTMPGPKIPPEPPEPIENPVVTMTRSEAEDKSVVIALGFERLGRTLPGHHPIVMSFLGITGAQVVFRYMREDSQRFLLAVFD